MVKDLADQKNIDKEQVLSAIKAVKEKGWDVNPYTVADEANIPREELYRNAEAISLISEERGDGRLESEEGSADRVQELENRVRQLEIQNQVLTLQNQTAWELGHQAGLIEGRKKAEKEIAARLIQQQAEAVEAVAAAHGAGAEPFALAPAPGAEDPASPLAPEEGRQAPAPDAEPSAPPSSPDIDWGSPDEQAAEAPAKQDNAEEEVNWHASAMMQSGQHEQLKPSTDNDLQPPGEPQAAAPVAEAGRAADAAAPAKPGADIVNLARSGPYVASNYNPLIELSWKDLETVYHFRAATLKDYARNLPNPSQSLTGMPAMAKPESANGESGEPAREGDERDVKMKELNDLLGFDGTESFQDLEPLGQDANAAAFAEGATSPPSEPAASSGQYDALSGSNFDQTSDFPAQSGDRYDSAGEPSEHFAPDDGSQGYEEQSTTQDLVQPHASTTLDNIEPISVESLDNVLDLDSLDIFEGVEEYGNLEDIDIIQDVQLPSDDNSVSGDQLRELIKSRIKQAGEVMAETATPTPGLSESASASAAASANNNQEAAAKGAAAAPRSKFVGGKAGAAGTAKPEAPPSGAPVSGATTGPQPAQAGGPIVRNLPPEIRRSCLILGIRPEDMSIEAVQVAWKKQIVHEGVHPDLGGDTESAIYLNTAKDTLLRFLHAQAPKLGKKFGKGGGPAGPPGAGQPPDKS